MVITHILKWAHALLSRQICVQTCRMFPCPPPSPVALFNCVLASGSEQNAQHAQRGVITAEVSTVRTTFIIGTPFVRLECSHTRTALSQYTYLHGHVERNRWHNPLTGGARTWTWTPVPSVGDVARCTNCIFLLNLRSEFVCSGHRPSAQLTRLSCSLLLVCIPTV